MSDALEARIRTWAPPFEFPHLAGTPEGFAQMNEAVADMMSAIDAAVRPGFHMMERACKHVLALGYEPSECLIQHHRPIATPVHGDSTERHVLVVLGDPCFEVATRREWRDMKLLMTHTPRLIKWPDPVLHCGACGARVTSGHGQCRFDEVTP